MFEKEPGYFIGACYVGFFASAFIVFLVLLFVEPLTGHSATEFMVPLMIFVVAFNIAFLPHTRSLWMAVEITLNLDESKRD